MTPTITEKPSLPSGLHALIVIGGFPPSPLARDRIEEADVIVCADSGLDHARQLGLRPHVLVGDMDSISAEGRHWATASNVEMVTSSPNKDETDTELALQWSVDHGADRVTLLWGGGDRIDHVLGVLAAVAAEHLSVLRSLRLWIDNDEAVIVHGPRTIDLIATPGSIVSLLPLAGDVHNVITSGLRWNLNDETLRGDAARGVSNIVDGPATISIGSGALAVILPSNDQENRQ